MIKVILIAAISADGKIAERTDQNSLDWTSKEDTRFFIERTKQAGALIMGRKTFESIGKPLPGRINLILTKDANYRQEGCNNSKKSFVCSVLSLV